MSVYKELAITERVKFRLGGQFANIFNHPQFIAGSNPGTGYGVNDVESFASVSDANFNYVSAFGGTDFHNARKTFPSNARTITIVGKITF
jgi:hypothetical protein